MRKQTYESNAGIVAKVPGHLRPSSRGNHTVFLKGDSRNGARGVEGKRQAGSSSVTLVSNTSGLQKNRKKTSERRGKREGKVMKNKETQKPSTRDI